jgi:hypothetical protein
MFRASIGKLSEFPRSVDFRASVTLSLSATSRQLVIGEPLVVFYSYLHDDDSHLPPQALRTRHSSMDWIGLFAVPVLKDGSSPGADAAGTYSANGRVCLNEDVDFGEISEPGSTVVRD